MKEQAHIKRIFLLNRPLKKRSNEKKILKKEFGFWATGAGAPGPP